MSRIVKKLYLIQRRDEFRAQKCFQDRCEINPVISILRSSVVKEIQGTDKVSGIVVENKKTGETKPLPVDGVFVFVGFEPQGDFYPPGLARDQGGFVITDDRMRTNIPGVFAAGDIRPRSAGRWPRLSVTAPPPPMPSRPIWRRWPHREVFRSGAGPWRA